MEIGMNILQKTLTWLSLVSTLPIKLKALKSAHFEVNCHSILSLNRKNEPVS